MKKRYAICGVSSRALSMFVKPMLTTFRNQTEVVGLLDPDSRRFEVAAEQYPDLAKLPRYGVDDLERMLDETKPDVLVVAGRDCTHARYVLAGLARDLDVLVEKPMAANAADCQKIIDAQKASKGRVQVTFNYRYAPVHRRLKELVLEGRVGRVTSVDLTWYIDTYHGASYFRRWNRYRDISGGLSIHKASHHFDLVRWWIDQKPVEIFAYGALNYYGPDGPENPSRKDGRHCVTCDEKGACTYYRRWNYRSGDAEVHDDHLGLFRGDRPKFTGYSTDACIFDSDIKIEDTYTATIRYDGGALLAYSCNFSTPYEGYRLAINGTKGRLESTEYHIPERIPFPITDQTIEYYPLFGSKEIIHVVGREGGHSGGDPVLLEDIFLGPDPYRNYEIASSALDGALAVSTGEAVWKSVRDGRPYKLSELLQQ